MPPVKEEELVIVPGVTTGADLLSQILFEPGDYLLVMAYVTVAVALTILIPYPLP